MKRILCVLLLAALFLSSAAEAGVVLVLSGGGTRGFAHIGVIEVLEEQGIPVVGIVGTSIGSLIGALNASGYNAKALRRAISELDLPALLAENIAPMFTPTGNTRKTKMNTVPALSYRRTGKQSGPLGLLEGDRLFEHFRLLMRNIEATNFDHLPIPYAAVATDIRTGEKIVLRSGSLASAMRASMSIPGLFEPWEIDGRLLVDGGLVSNLPVDTARELFPGLPIVAVDVSDYPTKDRRISNFVDVIDQSLTIVMRRTTEEEAARADIIVAPQVQEFSFLDDSTSQQIIQRGRDAVMLHLEKIKSLSKGASLDLVNPYVPATPVVIADVQIRGLPEGITQQLRKRYLRWVGKPLDHKDVESTLERLMSTSDISTVDYRLESSEEGKYALILDVRRRPDLELGLSGYTTNLNPNRWLHLKGVKRGLFSEMDSLKSVFYLGEQWGVDLTYLSAPEPLNAWDLTLSARNRKMNTSNGNSYDWNRYVAGTTYHFRFGDVDMGVGVAYEYVDGRDGYASSFGPTLLLAYDTLDIPSDPTKGSALRLNLWWPDAEDVLYRLTYFKPIQVSGKWRTYLRLGYAEGDLDRQGHAAYLGAAEELYSISSRPVEAERMAWVNVAFRRVLKRTILGIVATELFGSYGYAMDKDYEKLAAPWEVGVAASFPNNIVNVKVAAMYGSEEFKVGFFLGLPIWNHYPLP